MYLKDIINKKIAINCRTKEETNSLCEYAKENGLNELNLSGNDWNIFKENSCFVLLTLSFGNTLKVGHKINAKKNGFKIITLDDLEDFKQTKETIKTLLIKDCISITVAFNKTKKKLYLNYLGKEIRVKCDEKDKFDWEIGLGLALYRVYQKQNDVKYMKKNYNYKKLAEYCLYKFYNFDENKIKDLEDRVNNSEENTLIRL